MSPHGTGAGRPQRQTETTFPCCPHDLISKFKQGNVSRNGLLGPSCPENAYFIAVSLGQDSEGARQRPDKASRRPLETLSPAVSPAPRVWGDRARRWPICLQLRPRPGLGSGRCLPGLPRARGSKRLGQGRQGGGPSRCRKGLPSLPEAKHPKAPWAFSH